MHLPVLSTVPSMELEMYWPVLATVFHHGAIYILAGIVHCSKQRAILRGTRNLSFVLRRSLLRNFETIWILVKTLECNNITASKSIRRERKMRPMELSGVNFGGMGQNQSVHVLIKSYVSVCDELHSHTFV